MRFILTISAFSLIGVCQAQFFSATEKSLHDSIVNSTDFDETTKAHLRSFTQSLITYSHTVFVQQFSDEWTGYFNESELYKDWDQMKAIWLNIGVPLESWDTYYNDNIVNGMIKEEAEQIKDVIFVGLESFGGNGYRLFLKVCLNDHSIHALRIFLFPSGPGGTMEIHGSYG